ncbi:MAG: tyrosine-type recombinase/integrase, partial [Armatimonadota bacterium]
MQAISLPFMGLTTWLPAAPQSTPSHPRGLGLDGALEEYLTYLRDVRRKAAATIAAYRADIRRLTQYLGANEGLDLRSLEPALIEHWMGSMSELSDSTVRRSLTALSGLFGWAIRMGHATHNPVAEVERPRKRTRIQPCPTKDEVAAMLAATRSHAERAALLGMATGGLRRAELLSLTWENVDLPGCSLRVRGKGDKDRQVLVFEELLTELHALRSGQGLPEAGPVLRGKQGKPLQMSTLQRWVKSWLERGGINGRYTLHSLRRFAAKN